MKLITLFIISAVFFVIGGLSSLMAPESSLSSGYYAEAGEVAPWVARLNGAMFLGLAALTWFARNSGESEARRAILLALIVVSGLYFVVHLVAVISGVGPPALWWFGVAIFLFFTLGYGYFRFMSPERS